MALISELINRRRRQILVHSVIYYRMNDSIISDEMFDKIAKDLVELQAKYPEIAETTDYAEYFRDFDGSSGFDLPLERPEIVAKAYYLLNIYKRRTVE
jgi:hypothetical protein